MRAAAMGHGLSFSRLRGSELIHEVGASKRDLALL